jgi:hypothetical protein
MRKNFIFVFFCLYGVACAGSGVAAGVQKAWGTKDDAYIVTAGYMLRLEKRDFEYYEGGVLVLPGIRSKTMINEAGLYSRQYQNAAYGFYGGYFYYLMPIFRPGILVGTAVSDKVIYNSKDDTEYYLHSYGDFKIDYYIAFSIQAGAFSFTVSNYGIGGGLNYMF